MEVQDGMDKCQQICFLYYKINKNKSWLRHAHANDFILFIHWRTKWTKKFIKSLRVKCEKDFLKECSTCYSSFKNTF